MVRVFLIIFLLCINSLYAQENKYMNECEDESLITTGNSPEEIPIFDKDSQDPQRLHNFLLENLRYPKMAIKDKIEGRIYIKFWIDTAGYTHNHRIIKGVREDLDREALRVAKLIKFDEPAKTRGKPVGYCFFMVIPFNLPEK